MDALNQFKLKKILVTERLILLLMLGIIIEIKIMTTDNTLTKLNEMRMSAMAETLTEQLVNTEYQERIASNY